MEQEQDKDYIHVNGKDYIPVPAEVRTCCKGCAFFVNGRPCYATGTMKYFRCGLSNIFKEYHRPISFEEEPHKEESKRDKHSRVGIHKQSYYSFPNGVEAEDICRYLSFNLGNVIKYICRAGRKEGNDAVTDLNKAMDYLKNEIELKKEK